MAYPKNILLIDVETTGLDPAVHVIHEIGAVLVSGETLEILSSLDLRFRIDENAVVSQEALDVSKVSIEELQRRSVTLTTAIRAFHTTFMSADRQFNPRICAWNVSFDWGFLKAAYKQAGLEQAVDVLDYHTIDLFTAYDIHRAKRKEFTAPLKNLKQACEELNLDYGQVTHHGFDDCMTEYKILKTVLE